MTSSLRTLVALAAVLAAACGDSNPTTVDATDPTPDGAVAPDGQPAPDAPPGDVCNPNPCTAPNQTVCTVVGGQAACGCDPGYHDDRGACVIDTQPSGDDHGDTYATGTPMLPNAQLEVGVIEFDGDQDWFRIPLMANHVYELITAGGGVVNAAVTAPGGAPELASGSTFRWKATAAGSYGIRVTRPAGFTGAYTLQVLDRGLDDYGDDLAGAGATPDAALGATIAGALQFPHDQDWVPFAVTSGHRYQVEVTGQASLTTFEVRSGTGAVLDFGVNPYVTATGARLYVRVYDTAEFYGTFTVRVTEFINDDDHGDTYGTATLAAADGQPRSGSIETAGDDDWFRFPAVADRVYQVAVAPGGTSLAAAAFAPGGAPPEVGGGADFRWKAAVDGFYGVRVQRPGGFTGAYTLRIDDRGPDDFGDSLATATATTSSAVGTTVPGELQFPHDQDWVPFTVTAGHRYEFTFTAQPNLATYEVYADDGTRLFFGTNTYVTATTGRLFVKVFDTGAFYGAFTVQAREAP